MKRPRRGDVVEVVWRDAEHIAMGWAHASSYRKETGTDTFVTVGYWNGRAGDCVSLVASIGVSKVADGQSIPSGCILAIRVLRRADPERAKVMRL